MMIKKEKNEAVAMSRPELMDMLRQCSKRLGECIEACDWQNAESTIEERNDLLRALAATLNQEISLQPESVIQDETREVLTEIQNDNAAYISDLTGKIRQHRQHVQELRMGRRALSQYKQGHTKDPRFLNTVG